MMGTITFKRSHSIIAKGNYLAELIPAIGYHPVESYLMIMNSNQPYVRSQDARSANRLQCTCNLQAGHNAPRRYRLRCRSKQTTHGPRLIGAQPSPRHGGLPSVPVVCGSLGNYEHGSIVNEFFLGMYFDLHLLILLTVVIS